MSLLKAQRAIKLLGSSSSCVKMVRVPGASAIKRCRTGNVLLAKLSSMAATPNRCSPRLQFVYFASSFQFFNIRGFTTTRPTANKYSRLESLEAGASIALEALLDSEGSNTELPAAGPEETKELLKSARVCLIEITNLFIAWSREDEMYMFKFDEEEAPEGSELYRARAVVATMLKCVAHDLRRIPNTHPSRSLQGNESEKYTLGYMINELIEAADKHLQHTDGSPPANWSDFWDDVYILMHAMIGKLREAGYGNDQ